VATVNASASQSLATDYAILATVTYVIIEWEENTSTATMRLASSQVSGYFTFIGYHHVQEEEKEE
jgi:hypothetical protein